MLSTETSTETSTDIEADQRHLRLVLATNATTSGLGGVTAVVLTSPLDDLLGTDSPGWVRLVGAGLVLFAAFVWWVSRADRPRLRRETPSISAGDAAWVVGTVVGIALGWFSTGGAVLMALVATMVGTFGVAQAVLVRRLGRA